MAVGVEMSSIDRRLWFGLGGRYRSHSIYLGGDTLFFLYEDTLPPARLFFFYTSVRPAFSSFSVPHSLLFWSPLWSGLGV